MRRTLSLGKETLTELTPRELGSVAGGAITYYCTAGRDCRIPTDHCRLPTEYCASAVECLSYAMDPCVTYGCL